MAPSDGFPVTKRLFPATHKLSSHARFIHVQFGCTCCCMTSVSMKKWPIWKGFECETILHGTGPFPPDPDSQQFPLVSYRRPQDTVGFLDLAEQSMASEIFPWDFEEKALRQRHFRERTLHFGFQFLALGFILFALFLLIRFIVRDF